MSNPVRAIACSLKSFIAIGLVASLAAGCASTRVVPFTVQSDPLGAHVVYQVQSNAYGAESTHDWIYLGVTPVDIRREIATGQLRKADAFVLRVMKEGYLDQQRSWTGPEMLDELSAKKRVFWNPRLVPSSN